MKVYQKLLTDFDELFLGYASLGIIASSCIGSVAAMLILMQGHTFINMFQLFIVVTVCMGFNATVLAQLSHKFVFNSLIVSVLTSLFFITINLI